MTGGLSGARCFCDRVDGCSSVCWLCVELDGCRLDDPAPEPPRPVPGHLGSVVTRPAS